MRSIAITGSSGYYGRRLIAYARSQDPEVRILGLDVTEPRDNPPDEFARIDVRDPALREAITAFAPDTLVHLAFVVNPIRDDRKMHEINVGGTRNVFEAVTAAKPRRFLMASSASVFGAWPDNPVPMDESWPIRARPEYRYAVDKTDLERQIAQFAQAHPDVAVSWVRPATIYGPGVNNFLSRLLLNLPLVSLPDGNDTPLQFVHEDDVAAATWLILRENARGAFNLGPPDWVSTSEMAREAGRRTIRIPFWMLYSITTMWWGLRLPIFDFPPAIHYYLRYPWVVAPNRLVRELGFTFKYSSIETLRELLRAHNRLD
jgi:UDP-glucose 4-epimerase